MKRLIVTITLLFCVAFGVLAADVTGKWTAQVPSRQAGQTREQTFNFKAEGGKLTGTVSGRQNDVPILNGTISGDTISFTVKMQYGDNTVEQKYTGTVSGDEIKFKREGGQGPAREFTAKRAK
ncbi:MAG: hypothetical protein ACE15B_07480 [Bryobacteraceae bacterium]